MFIDIGSLPGAIGGGVRRTDNGFEFDITMDSYIYIFNGEGIVVKSGSVVSFGNCYFVRNGLALIIDPIKLMYMTITKECQICLILNDNCTYTVRVINL